MVNIPPLNQAQSNLYDAYFRQVDPSGTGTVGAVEAASFLKKSGLSESVLHLVWNISDHGSRGYLDRKGFFIALKLISLAQNGKEVSTNNLSIPTPAPSFGESPRGNIPPIPREQVKVDTTGWLIKAKEKLQYDGIFDGLHPVNGFLSGEKVKPVLLNSKLAVDMLGKIWDISDIDQDGSLDRDEFAVAMHLVYRALDGESVPQFLPVVLIPPSKRKLSIQPTLPQKPSPQPTVVDQRKWVISSADRAKYNALFSTADTNKDGFVSGIEVKDILLSNSPNLPQTKLAHIWSLCDKNNSGLLNADQFAFAMHLINLVKLGKELPTDISADMISPAAVSTPVHQALKASSDLADISLESSSSDFSAIKELDQITTEIEALGREKASLQKEINETEEAIRNRKLEIEGLQDELTKGNKGLDILNEQKTQSQSQLDTLDNEKSKYEEQYNEIQAKIQDETLAVKQLRAQFISSKESCKTQESELQIARKELEKVRKEESFLENELDNNRREFESLKAKVARARSETAEVQAKINKMSEENNSLKEEIAEMTASSNNLPNGNLNELNDFDTRFKDMDQISARATAGSSPVSSISGFSGSGGRDEEENYDFKDTDPFKSEKDDPFGGNVSDNIDPFISDDPFNSDPFASGVRTDDFSLSNHKGDPFVTRDKTDPFASGDPFATSQKDDPFSSSRPNNLFSSKDKDPFSGDPFQGGDPFKEDTIQPPDETPGVGTRDPFTSLDPFGSGAFVSSNSGKSAFPPITKSIESSSSDPFSNGNAISDSGSLQDIPQEIDDVDHPSSKAEDRFVSDPFADAEKKDSDPYTDVNDPFPAPGMTDPFASHTENEHFAAEGDTTNVDPAKSDLYTEEVTKPADPFAASVSGFTTEDFPTTSSNTNDPFATGVKTDPFATSHKNDPFASSNDPFSSEAAIQDPFTSTKADPFTNSENDPFSNPVAVNMNNDPFASEVSTAPSSDDPFNSNMTSESSDPWFAFGDNSVSSTSKVVSKSNPISPPTNMSEENQLQWAKRESEREESERKKRMKELQDQEEMQIALALKHSVESSSDA